VITWLGIPMGTWSDLEMVAVIAVSVLAFLLIIGVIK
jgi:hypothetical protein